MNIVILLGSRNPEGQTAQAANAFLEGVREAGGEGELLFLPQMTIERCRQCKDDGWGLCRAEGRCVIEDDFAGVADKVIAADAVAFANPVYFSDLSESLRAFLDRLRRTCINEDQRQKVAGKPAIGICVAGGKGGGSPACVESLERVLARCGFDVIDMVPARRQNLDLKLTVLRETGKWMAKGL